MAKRKFTLSVFLKGIDKLTAPTRKAATAMKKFTAPIKRVADRLRMAGKRMKDFGDKMSGIGRRVAIGLTVLQGAVSAIILKVAAFGDTLAKTADRLGLTIAELQKLQFAGRRAGLSTEEMNNNLRFFNRVLGEAKTGTAEYKEAFDRLGISLEESPGKWKAPRDIISEIADAFTELDDDTTKAALAQDMFGKAGAKMINLLAGGSKGLKEMGDRLEELGLISDETARRSEEFTDVMEDLKTSIFSNVSNIVGKYLPSISQTISRMTDWITKSENLSMVKGKLIEVIDSAVIIGKSFYATISDIFSAVKSVIDVIAELTGWLGLSTKEMTGLAKTGKVLAFMFSTLLFGAVIKATGVFVSFAATGIGVAVTAIIALTSSIYGAVTATWAFTAAVLATPIGWVIAAIAGLITIGVLLYKNWDELISGLKNIGKWFVKVFSSIWETVSGVVRRTVEAGRNFVAGIKSGIRSSWSSFKSWLTGVFINLIEGIPGASWLINKLSGGSYNQAVEAFTSGSEKKALATEVAVQQSRFQGRLQIDFGNAPPGTRIVDVETDGGGMELETGLQAAVM